MMSANIKCSICLTDYRKTDEIVGTTCGHIFHNNCLQNWLRQSSTCPQCRKQGLNPRKIFLEFGERTETVGNSDEILKLQRELEKCKKNLKSCQKNFSHADGNYAQLLEKFEKLQIQNEQLKKNQNFPQNICPPVSSSSENLLLRAELERCKKSLKSFQETSELMKNLGMLQMLHDNDDEHCPRHFCPIHRQPEYYEISSDHHDNEYEYNPRNICPIHRQPEYYEISSDHQSSFRFLT